MISVIGVRPRAIVGFFSEIAKTIPLDFAQGHGTAKFYFPVAQADNLPVAATGAVLNIYFLPDTKWIRPKNRNCFFIHSLNPSPAPGLRCKSSYAFPNPIPLLRREKCCFSTDIGLLLSNSQSLSNPLPKGQQ